MIENTYFLQELQQMLTPEDYQAFLKSWDRNMYKALRINTLKADYEKIAGEIALGEVCLFDKDTYLIDDEHKWGKHPFHLAGLYYLQEPSATMVVNALDVQKGDKVLDLCAAPGGKSTHILAKLDHTGFLLSNEYDRKRAQTLLSNLERWGAKNFLLTNATVEELCPKVAGYFDKVVVDAPCSGASMFKKYPETIKDYHENSVLACQKRQLHILNQAYLALKENGTLVYSTCTYNMYENELAVQQFLQTHPDMQLVDSQLNAGRKGFDPQGYCRRCFPMDEGEGHFLAKMIKTSSTKAVRIKTLPFSKEPLVERFLDEVCWEKPSYTVIKDKIYLTDSPLLEVKVNCLRQGVLLGEILKGRIQPAHHFFITEKRIKNIYDIVDETQLQMFLKGLSLPVAGIKGYVQIRYHDVPIGFGKADGQQIKNHFPKGLRLV